jgi:hypothetical protein
VRLNDCASTLRTVAIGVKVPATVLVA